MTVLSDPPSLTVLLAKPSNVQLRPRYEGSNICTWIGFKHVNYLIEEAVLEHFRKSGLPARALYEDHALGLDILELDTRIASALHMDDLVNLEVTPKPQDGEELAFVVNVYVDRDGAAIKAASSKVRVVLRVDDWLSEPVAPPAELEQFTVDRIASSESLTVSIPNGVDRHLPRSDESDPILEKLTSGSNAFGWKWRVPYFYCHFNQRVQMSGYLRQMEEVVDLFLASRGISIRHLLEQRKWIPVVPHSRIRILDETLMEEDLYTIYTVDEVFKDLTYTARMDCYVVREGKIVPVSSGVITHGYAVIENRRDWRLVNFDERVLNALNGEPNHV